MASILINCNCKHEYQDNKYGNGVRVANLSNKGWRCVVCSSIKAKAGETEDKKKGKK